MMRRCLLALSLALVPLLGAGCSRSVAPPPAPAVNTAPTAAATPRAQAKPSVGKIARKPVVAGVAGAVTAKVKDAFGLALVRTPGATKWRNVNVGDVLPAASRVKTGPNAAVLLSLKGNHIFRIGAGTEVLLTQLGENKSFSFGMVTGQVWSLVQKAARPTRYEVTTPSATVGVAGTVFSVGYNPRTTATAVSTREGVVTVRQGRRGTRVRRGQQTRVYRNMKRNPRPVPQPSAERRKWNELGRTEDWLAGVGALLSLRDYGGQSGVRRASAAGGRLPASLQRVLSSNHLKDAPRAVAKDLLNERLRRETRRLDPALRSLVDAQLGASALGGSRLEPWSGRQGRKAPKWHKARPAKGNKGKAPRGKAKGWPGRRGEKVKWQKPRVRGKELDMLRQLKRNPEQLLRQRAGGWGNFGDDDD